MLELLQHQALWVLTMHRNGAHDGPESVLTFARNHCSRSTGMGAHDAPEYAPISWKLFFRIRPGRIHMSTHGTHGRTNAIVH
jgi:hypothetical protein